MPEGWTATKVCHSGTGTHPLIHAQAPLAHANALCMHQFVSMFQDMCFEQIELMGKIVDKAKKEVRVVLEFFWCCSVHKPSCTPRGS